MIPDALEEAIEANKTHRPRELTEKKPYWGILYILSCFQNPRGMNLPPGTGLRIRIDITVLLLLLFYFCCCCCYFCVLPQIVASGSWSWHESTNFW